MPPRNVGVQNHLSAIAWAAILVVVGVVWTIAQGIAGNLLTRRIENWWARRSKRAVERRIQQLEAELAECSELPLLTEAEAKILQGIEDLISVLAIVSAFIVGLLAGPFRTQGFWSLVRVMGILLVELAGWSLVIWRVFAYPLMVWRLKRTESFRRWLESDIEKLRGSVST